MTSDTALAYIAGIIDGEGTITFQRNCKISKNPVVIPSMTVSNTNRELLEWISNQLGAGRIYTRTSVGNRKTAYVLQFNISDIRRILPLLTPYLIVKLRQAKVVEYVLSMQHKGKKRTEYQNYMVDICFDAIRVLNKRGVDAICY